MIDLAKLIRKDRELPINETHIREEVTRVMDLEKDIANVSMQKCVLFGDIGFLQKHIPYHMEGFIWHYPLTM